ncbi:MAG: insulinase family protein [Bacteroidales bacterium]|nr:insulinase family protein [Bacteroidales bacterium]
MKRLIFGAIALFITISLTAQVNLTEKLPFDESITHGKMENGMEYYIKSNPKPENRAELTLVVNAGSVLEDEDQQGLAHFTEHMAFNGTKNFPKHELINYLESTGMKFGADVNAYTSFDETVYGITIALDDEEMLDKGLLVLHDWAHLVSFEDEEIDAERGVIHEEWRMGQGAQDRMMREYLPKIFHNSQYANRLPIGTMEVVDNCEHEALRRFYQEWYRPDLMAVVVVGDFDQAEMEQRVKDLFSKIPTRENPSKRKMFDIPDHKEALVSIASDPEAPMSMIQMYTKLPLMKLETVNDYKEQIVSTLISSILSSRLSELTRLENPPFMQGYAAHTNFIGPKSIYMNIGIAQNNDVMGAMEALVKENQRAKQHGFTETELEREKSSLLKQMEKAYNERNKRKSSEIVNELKAHYLFPHNPVPGIEYEYELYNELIPMITLEDVNEKMETFIKKENTVIVAMLPEKEGIEIPTEEEVLAKYDEFNKVEVEAYVDKVNTKPLISNLPEPKPVVKASQDKKLDYTVWEFENGVRIVIKETNFKDDEILFKAKSYGGASLYDQKDDISLDIATDVAMESGLGNYDRTELDRFLSDKNVNLSPYIGETSEGLNGKTSVEDLETLLQMIYASFTSPRVTETAFNSYINKTKALLENQSLDPQSVWQDSIRTIMASNHPRRRVLTPELLDEAEYKRINYILKTRFGDPGNFTFYFTGNINPEEVKPLFEKYLGGLAKVNREENWKDLGIVAPKGIVDKTVYKGEDEKTMIVINFHGKMDYTVNDRLELEAISSILSTKLLEEIREEKSGVYTVGAYPNASRIPDEEFGVTIFFSCDPVRIDELTKGIFAEIKKLQENGPSEVDLNKAIQKQSRELETSLKENRFWMRKLEEVNDGSMKTKDVLSYQKYIDKLNAKDLQEAAVKYFDMNNYVRVVLKPEQN